MSGDRFVLVLVPSQYYLNLTNHSVVVANCHQPNVGNSITVRVRTLESEDAKESALVIMPLQIWLPRSGTLDVQDLSESVIRN